MKRFILIGALVLSVAAANAQLTIVDNIGGAWMDISGTGTPLSLGDDGEADITMTVSNAVFGAGTVRVGSNGAIGFNAGATDLHWSNLAIPDDRLFGFSQALAPFWDDINTSGGVDGEIYWEEIGGTLVVSWVNVAFFGTQDRAWFQVQVHSSGPGLAQFVYGAISSPRADNGGSATIGYQDGGAGFNDVQWSFNTTGAVSSGDVLTLVPEPASMIALGAGLVALAARRRRKKAA